MDKKNRRFLIGNACALIILLGAIVWATKQVLTYSTKIKEAQVALENASAYKEACELYVGHELGYIDVDWSLVLSKDTKEQWHIASQLLQDLKNAGEDYSDRHEALVEYLQERSITFKDIGTSAEEVERYLKEHALRYAKKELRLFMTEENPSLRYFREFETHLKNADLTYSDVLENGDVSIPRIRKEVAKKKVIHAVNVLRENVNFYGYKAIDTIEECMKFGMLTYKEAGIEREEIVRRHKHVAAELALQLIEKMRGDEKMYSYSFELLDEYLARTDMTYEDIGTSTKEIRYLKAKHNVSM